MTRRCTPGRSAVRSARMRALRSLLALLPVLAALLGTLIWSEMPARAGGPLFVGSPTMGTDGQFITWDTSSPVAYRVDGGTLGTIANPASRVQSLFDVWQNVATATISYSNAGAIQSTGAFSDGDVSSASEFNDVATSCDNGVQSPIIFDADGSMFSQLGFPSGVIGFAGMCSITNGKITSALGVLNGRWINGNQSDGELTSQEFDQAFVHEFGHFSGMDHSQINVNVLTGPLTCAADELAGLPLMFPFLACQARASAGLPVLAPDDIAWISKQYPAPSFTTSYGFITGTIFFSDGITHAGGVNVIARQINNPATTTINESRRTTFSVVSGYLFTGNVGQSVTGTNPGSSLGSRNPALIGTFEIPVLPGTYTVEVESISPYFGGGSSVGPMQFPIPAPGSAEFWNSTESNNDAGVGATNITVASGQTISNINIILNTPYSRFDAFESASLLPGPPAGEIADRAVIFGLPRRVLAAAISAEVNS